MKSLYESETVVEVISRIDKPTTERQWRKMDVAQMLAHCSATMDMASGRLNPPRILIGRLIGPVFKSIFINEKPFGKNGPTDKKLIISDRREFAREQAGLKLRVRQFHEAGTLDVRDIRIPSSESLLRRIGAAACTSTSTTTSDSSARERQQQNRSLLTERWQLNQIVLGDRLEMSSGFAPSGQPPDDHERVESFFPQ